jgi:ribose 5-phosphate isomerase B
MRVFLGADHAGFKFKEKLKKIFEKKKMDYEDYGAYAENKEDDYPDYAFVVGAHVSKNSASLGILLCGSAVGMAIAANKVRGVRAVACNDLRTAKLSRQHNNANVLCLQARKTKFEHIEKIVNIWMKTKFSHEDRHRRRIHKISVYEAQR